MIGCCSTSTASSSRYLVALRTDAGSGHVVVAADAGLALARELADDAGPLKVAAGGRVSGNPDQLPAERGRHGGVDHGEPMHPEAEHVLRVVAAGSLRPAGQALGQNVGRAEYGTVELGRVSHACHQSSSCPTSSSRGAAAASPRHRTAKSQRHHGIIMHAGGRSVPYPAPAVIEPEGHKLIHQQVTRNADSTGLDRQRKAFQQALSALGGELEALNVRGLAGPAPRRLDRRRRSNRPEPGP